MAETLWNMLLRALDRRQADAHREALSQPLVYGADSSLVKSDDAVFALYELYKSIWGFAEPPCFDKSVGAIVLADNVGNQKRVRDAVKQLKAMFNNNDPAFCSFGAKLWRCTN